MEYGVVESGAGGVNFAQQEIDMTGGGYVLASFCFFFNDTATTEIYTLSLHDALPIPPGLITSVTSGSTAAPCGRMALIRVTSEARSEEHTSELQSQSNLVCRLLL